MADSLDILTEKFRISMRSFFPSNGILKYDKLSTIMTDQIAKSSNLIDSEVAKQCLYGIEKVFDIKFRKLGTDISWTTLDEIIESLKWFQLKNPRRFMMNWENKMSSIFHVIDRDGDGFVNQEEFNIYYQLGNRKDDTEFLTRAFGIVDTEKLGKVTKKQYVGAYVNYFSDPDISHEQLPMF